MINPKLIKKESFKDKIKRILKPKSDKEKMIADIKACKEKIDREKIKY